MRMRFVLAVAATVAALVTAGPVTAAVAAPAAATVTAAVAVPPGRVPGTRAAGCVLAAAAHQDAAGATYFSPDPGRRLIVLSPGETASADISFGVAGQRSDSVLATYLEIAPPGARRHVVLRIPGGAALVYRGRADVTAMARHARYYP